eukprot:COSAG05_NODE_1366_length_5062_cov_15.988762_3_plen_389_part_00
MLLAAPAMPARAPRRAGARGPAMTWAGPELRSRPGCAQLNIIAMKMRICPTRGIAVALAAALSLVAAEAAGPPVMSLGPTANLVTPDEAVDKQAIVSQLLKLVDSAGEVHPSWPSTFGFVNKSNGAIHVRQQVFGFMSPAQQQNFARATQKLGLRVSIESGGALCSGSGSERGAAAVQNIEPFLSAGGRLAFVALESIFSRTQAGCREQPVAETARQAAAFAQSWTQGLTAAGQLTPPELFLYDTPAHMTVGQWPPNTPTYHLDLGKILQLLQAAFKAEGGIELTGYWMDLPYELSRDFPNSTAPLPAGSGFKKIVTAAEIVRSFGLKVGKTYNSVQGGQTSNRLFYENTLKDWSAVKQAGASMDYAMVRMYIRTNYSFAGCSTMQRY